MTLILALVAAGCACPSLDSQDPDFGKCSIPKMVGMLDKDIGSAIDDGERFVADASYKSDWDVRVTRWQRLLGEILGRPEAGEGTELRNATERVNRVVERIRASEILRRRAVTSTGGNPSRLVSAMEALSAAAPKS